ARNGRGEAAVPRAEGFRAQFRDSARAAGAALCELGARAAAIVRRCLSKEPEQRYQRANELRAALEAIHLGGTALRAPSGPRPVRPREHRAGRKRLRALAVLPLENPGFDIAPAVAAGIQSDALW